MSWWHEQREFVGPRTAQQQREFEVADLPRKQRDFAEFTKLYPELHRETPFRQPTDSGGGKPYWPARQQEARGKPSQAEATWWAEVQAHRAQAIAAASAFGKKPAAWSAEELAEMLGGSRYPLDENGKVPVDDKGKKLQRVGFLCLLGPLEPLKRGRKPLGDKPKRNRPSKPTRVRVRQYVEALERRRSIYSRLIRNPKNAKKGQAAKQEGLEPTLLEIERMALALLTRIVECDRLGIKARGTRVERLEKCRVEEGFDWQYLFEDDAYAHFDKRSAPCRRSEVASFIMELIGPAPGASRSTVQRIVKKVEAAISDRAANAVDS